MIISYQQLDHEEMEDEVQWSLLRSFHYLMMKKIFKNFKIKKFFINDKIRLKVKKKNLTCRKKNVSKKLFRKILKKMFFEMLF